MGWENAKSSDIFPRVNKTPEKTSQIAPPLPRSVAVIGMGLLGGSVAKSLRRIDPQVRLVGCARREETRQFMMDQNIVDVATADPLEASRQVELVVVATPVDRIADTVVSIAEAVPGVFVTDVGSTKSQITESVSRSSDAAQRFVAAHPIAGSEKTGVENAISTLFDGRPVVITPTGMESEAAIASVEAFWRAMGGLVVRLSPERHDQLLAISSHMPHLMASLIAGQLPVEAKPIVGAGWLDTTRIAAGDPKLWTAIVNENRAAIANTLRSTRDELNQLIDQIENELDGDLEDWLRLSQEVRQSIPDQPN